MATDRRSKIRAATLTLAWLGVVSIGFVSLLRYENKPGTAGLAPSQWPATMVGVALDPARCTLVTVVHPRCPCSRASLAELGRLLAECNGKVAAHVVMVKPPGAPEGFEKTDLFTTASD